MAMNTVTPIPFLSNKLKVKLVALFIALSLTVTYYYLIKPWAMGTQNNSTNFWVFSAMSHANYHLQTLYPVWRPRVGGLWISGRLVDSVVQNGQMNTEDIQNVFGLYHAYWLFAFFCMLILLVEDPVFVILGCFAGLFYMFTPRAEHYSYPWDMPSMTFFTLSYLLWIRKHYDWMLAVIFIGYLFKETVLVTAVLFFFTDLTLRKKIIYFVIAGVSTLLLKIGVTFLVDGKIELLTQDLTRGDSSGKLMTLITNLHELFTPDWNHFIFVNAGTFMAALFLPVRNKIEWGTKTLLLIFFVGQMFAGALHEYRIMLEAVPIAILYLRQSLWDEPLKIAGPIPTPPVKNKAKPALPKK
jgi:hypothetical protein